MRVLTLLLALSLTTTLVALAPTASADSCRSSIAENTVCTPAYALYCAIYAGKHVVSCEANVVAHCVEWCPRDLDPFLS